MALLLVVGLSDRAMAQEPRPDQSPIPSADSSEEEDDENIKSVVVTINRAEKREFEVARAVEIVSRDDAARMIPGSLPDLLQETTGVLVQQTNAGAGAPIIRGMIGPDNLILVDGVRFNNSTFRTGPNQYLALIDPWALRQVEVLRGPGSVIYGSDAVGGVINAISLAPRRLGTHRVGLSGRGMFTSAWQGGGGSAQADLNAGSLSGYAGGTYGYFGELRAGGGETQPLSDHERASLRFKSTADVGHELSLTWAAFATAIRGAGRTEKLYQGRHRNYDNDDILTYVRLQKKGHGLLHHLNVNFSYHLTHDVEAGVRCHKSDGLVDDKAACLAMRLDNLTMRYEKEEMVHTPGFFATLESKFLDGALSTVVGGEGYLDVVGSSQQEANSDNGWAWNELDRGNFSDGSRYLSAGLFAKADADIIRFGESRIGLGAGGRVSHFGAHAPDVPGLGNVDYSHTGFVGTAGINYLLRDALNLYVDFSQGFRAPNLQETTVLGDTGTSFEAPNDKLTPIFSNTLEVGAKTNLGVVRLYLAGFATWVDDDIERETLTEAEYASVGLTRDDIEDGTEVVRRVNAASGFYQGLEASLSTRPLWGFSLRANAMWIEGDVTALDGTSQPARRIPPLMGLAGLRWADANLGLHSEFLVKWATRQDRLNSGDEQDLRICEDPANPGTLLADCGGTPGFATLNLRAGYDPTDWMQINISAENLTDLNYRYHGSGIDAPGFNVLADISMTY